MKKPEISPAVSRWLSAEGLAPSLDDEAGSDELLEIWAQVSGRAWRNNQASAHTED